MRGVSGRTDEPTPRATCLQRVLKGLDVHGQVLVQLLLQVADLVPELPHAPRVLLFLHLDGDEHSRPTEKYVQKLKHTSKFFASDLAR